MTRIIGVSVERIQGLMERRGWDVGKLAYQADVSYDTIYKILRGERPNTSGEILGKLARALGCSVDYLMGLSDSVTGTGVKLESWEALDAAHIIDDMDVEWRRAALGHVRLVGEEAQRIAEERRADIREVLELIEQKFGVEERKSFQRALLRSAGFLGSDDGMGRE